MSTLVVLVKILLTVLVSVASQESAEQSPQKVNVAVYYEALGPDSVKFFNEQLAPHLHIIDKYVELKHVPFGKATHEMTDGKWVSTCRHTLRECEGHNVQACILRQTGAASLRNKFISCLMQRGDENKPYPTKECANEVLVQPGSETWQAFEGCIANETYEDTLEEFKQETNLLQPPLSSVPTIVFNGEDQDLALKHFAKLLCHYIEVNANHVPECEAPNSIPDSTTAYYSSVADNVVISYLLLTSVAVLATAHF